MTVALLDRRGEAVKYKIDWRVKKYTEDDVARLSKILGRNPQSDDFERAKVTPFEDNLVRGNLVTTAGWNRLTSLMIAGGGQAPTNTSARIGTGDGAGSAAVGDTDLSASAGSTHRWFQILDVTYPTQSNTLITMKATFASADGNYAWNEFGIDIGAPTVSSSNTVAALLLNHKTSIAQGTKTSGQSWTASATITFT